MGFELAADHLDDLHGIAEAVAGAVEGDEAVAAADVVDEGLFLGRGDGVDVGVDHEGVVVPEGFRVEVIGAAGVGEIDAERTEALEELGEAFGGFVVAVVAEEEDFEPLGSGWRGGEEACGEDEELLHDEEWIWGET
ncbi:MAG: hypothetical protein DVB22_000878 [Verrucomicrobia bacterium]|nr:MAG: hypothetical protein DVB22_000878 [Verrucomicrobiota bacterium]